MKKILLHLFVVVTFLFVCAACESREDRLESFSKKFNATELPQNFGPITWESVEYNRAKDQIIFYYSVDEDEIDFSIFQENKEELRASEMKQLQAADWHALSDYEGSSLKLVWKGSQSKQTVSIVFDEETVKYLMGK